MRGSLPRKVAKLATNFGLDVQRLAAAGDAPGVAGLDQLADLVHDLRIRARRGVGERLELALDVDGRLPTGGAARVARLEHLADLRVALGGVDGRGRAAGAPRAGVAILADRHPAAPDVVVQSPAREQRGDGQDDADAHHGEQHDAEGVLHASRLWTMWRRWRRRTMAPRRPILYEDQ